ncbi:MAG: putative Fe-S protein YdhL (DUF1289 family) [Pseudohongiellaceae bacterium]|jgi:predicted Fe-S protein YdhL (DUF1289 family)
MEEQVAVASPCMSICALDSADVCKGCYRTASEITQWGSLSSVQKREIILKAFEREKKVNPFLS